MCHSISVYSWVDCYVSDEVIVSRAGVRVRVVNTDAEGRMVMADLLCKAKESVRVWPCGIRTSHPHSPHTHHC